MAKRKKQSGDETLADRAYRELKYGILHGVFPEGSVLNEADVLSRYNIGRTPFREACNRLHNEQLLAAVPRRGYFVPELTFRGVRDLLEVRIMLEGLAAELAASRAQQVEIDELERCLQQATQAARTAGALDKVIESNQQFHLQIARMSHNRELEGVVRGVLERSVRLVYLAATSSKQTLRDIESLLKPILTAIQKRDAAAAHKAVVADITNGQLNALGRDFWGESQRKAPVVLEKTLATFKRGV